MGSISGVSTIGPGANHPDVHRRSLFFPQETNIRFVIFSRSTNKAKKVDKDALVKNIYHNLFNINPDGPEMTKVLQDVQFLINHNKIKKFRWYKKVFLTLKAYLFKRE